MADHASEDPCSDASTQATPSTVPSTAPSSGLPYIPTLAVTSPDNYGRLDAENESNLSIITGVPHPRSDPERTLVDYQAHSDSSSRKRSHASFKLEMPDEDPGTEAVQSDSELKSQSCPLLELPSELIHTIISCLDPYDLSNLSGTCQELRTYANSDLHWQRLVQDNVPGTSVKALGPKLSFRELYAAHERLWFLPKHKIWFSDLERTGRLILVRFDPRRGCIEGYQLAANREKTTYEDWNGDEGVVIHGFKPMVHLHKERPILHFPLKNDELARLGPTSYYDEIPIPLDDRLQGIYSNLLLAQSLGKEAVEQRLEGEIPHQSIWPPPIVPARHRISSLRPELNVLDLSAADRPKCRAEMSDQTFRIRRWMEMSGASFVPGLVLGLPHRIMLPRQHSLNDAMFAGASLPGVHLGEDISSYSTLDPALYTPTETRPWRGIWVGDYSGHGCEFLLLHQPDEPPATDAELDLVRLDHESDYDWEQRRLDARIYRGRLEGIKLTGDPNVPRGEYTFVADDIGPDGYVGTVDDAPFKGDGPKATRVVRSKGHVALTGFVDDKFIESQLLLISHNRLAQYWVEFGHISYFERVDIDQFLQP